MNEISILMYLLSKRKKIHQFGSTKEEILAFLNPGKNLEDHIFNQLFINLSEYIEPLGLQISYNALNSHWYIAHKKNFSELFNANPFNEHPSLAATLFCTLTSCLKNQGSTNLQEIRKLRKKKQIRDDIKKLQDLGYVNLDRNTGGVSLTPLIGYQIDLQYLFNNVRSKMDKE